MWTPGLNDMASGWQWKRHLFRRKESVVTTTWKFRLVVLVCCGLLPALTRGFWVPRVGRSLVCAEAAGRVDAILVDNLEQNYLVFERAAELRKAGLDAPVFVPTKASRDLKTLDMVSEGVVRVMARVAWLQGFEIIPITELEPITLNSAYQIRDYLAGKNIKSMVVVTPAFRSRRSFLVYEAVLGRAGVDMSCIPVFGQTTSETWADSWHGIQGVVEQFLKLQYYRFYVLPFMSQDNQLESTTGSED